MELWELVARESVRDLVARYNANGDAGRFAEVARLFTPDAVMELVSRDGTTRRFEGVDAITSVFTGTKAAWDAATTTAGSGRAGDAGPDGSGSPGGGAGPGGARHHVRHVVGTHQIDVPDPGHARGRSYFVVLMGHGLDHWGRYLDDYVVHEGEWRFARRRVLTDGHATGALAGRHDPSGEPARDG